MGDIYKNNALIRSLVQHSGTYKDQFIESFYSINNDGEIIFIVAIGSEKSFFLSFNVKSRSPQEVRDIIGKLKKDQEALLTWFCDRLSHQHEELDSFVFPRYKLPEIKGTTQITNVKVREVSLTKVHLLAESKLKLNQTTELDFSVGKTTFNLTIVPVAQDKLGYQANIYFKDYDVFNSWLKFIKVMSHREDQKSE